MTVENQLRRVGLPTHMIQLVEAEMSDDLKERIVSAETAIEIRDVLKEFSVDRHAENKPYPHP